MTKRQTLVTLVLVGIMALTSATHGLAALRWHNVPIWTIDGAQVDIGFAYEADCVAGPIAVEIQYPKGATILLVEEDAPPYGYAWTTKPRADFKAGKEHIDMRVIAVIPGTGGDGCRGEKAAGVRLTPLSDRFDEDTDMGRLGTELVVHT